MPETEASSADPVEDSVLVALFFTVAVPPPPQREHAKRRRGRNEDDARAQKREPRDLEAARKALTADEEAHQLRAIELAVGASSSGVVKEEKRLLMVL